MPDEKKSEQIKNIYLFHGENIFSSTAELNRWKDEFIKKHGDSDMEVFEDIEKTDGIISAILIAPFLSEKKLVIIKNYIEDHSKKQAKGSANESEDKPADEKQTKKLVSALSKVPSSTIVVFFEEKEIKTGAIFKKIKEIGTIKFFKIFTEFELQNFIKALTEKSKSQIKSDTIKYLIEAVNADSWAAEKEMEKLATYRLGKEITKEDIDMLVPPNPLTSIFKLTDAIGEKNASKAMKLFHTLVSSGENHHQIFSMILRHFRLLTLAWDLKNQNLSFNQIGQKFHLYDPRIQPFVISIYSQQAKNFNLDRLREIYAMLLKTDADTKTGKVKETVDNKTEAMLAMEKLIINLCK
ncbi:MAG: hypothetical protein UT33_C0011G0106 [Candidatus Peregrinibacteria bacterium GW2011_GWC2_39_14]|nr:MAG: hypothetical protein UT33_C0011G0106 [Candidatus Peregrinibacteria bacterium GW2011_GWC2_39_14]